MLGVPFLPPGAITDASNRAREMVNRLHARMAPPPVRILEGIFGMLDHRVLVALCAAGVPEALTGKTDPEVLASKIGVDPVPLERLLRFAATRGWVASIVAAGSVRPRSRRSFAVTILADGGRGSNSQGATRSSPRSHH